VHAGYRRYRKALLRDGVEMWEVKPDIQLRATAVEHAGAGWQDAKAVRSSLHAKAFILDRESLVIGSLNFDPRSLVLNTEMCLVIDSPTLTGSVADNLQARLKEGAYRLGLQSGSGSRQECASLVWYSQENGREVRYTREPQASLCQRLQVFLLSLLPIESQL
jgi:putative cardiolipin synthase